MTKEGGNEFFINLFVKLMGVLYLGAIVTASIHDVRRVLLVSAPLLLVFLPGYLGTFKVTHGTKCDCEQLDAHCEFGFWFELAAKFSLILPLLWTSIFFFYAIGDGIHRAVDETFLAIGLSGLYYLAYFLFTYAVVAAKKR